jgi:hypothetical protein
VRKIDGEKKIVALKSAAATLEFILQLEGDKQVLQEEGRGMALLGYCSFQASPKALYIFRYAAKRCASF